MELFQIPSYCADQSLGLLCHAADTLVDLSTDIDQVLINAESSSVKETVKIKTEALLLTAQQF